MKIVRFETAKKVYTGELSAGIIKYKDINGNEGVINLCDVNILAPVIPGKIIAVGLNYKDHAKELNMKIPLEPVIFLKPPSAIIGPDENIIYPEQSNRIDYEAEMAVIIGKKAKNVPKALYKDFVKGYTCFNDITARDLQKIDGQWTRAKSFDTFAPIGPFIVKDIDITDLYIRSYVNGEIKQDSNINNMIFDIPELIEFISKIMTLYPDDVIVTGTPSNIGPLNPGDIVEVEIQDIGRLTNKVAQS